MKRANYLQVLFWNTANIQKVNFIGKEIEQDYSVDIEKGKNELDFDH